MKRSYELTKQLSKVEQRLRYCTKPGTGTLKISAADYHGLQQLQAHICQQLNRIERLLGTEL